MLVNIPGCISWLTNKDKKKAVSSQMIPLSTCSPQLQTIWGNTGRTNKFV